MLTETILGKRILLGVCGGIACYKAVEVLRGLVRAGAEVQVVLTKRAQAFVGSLTFETLSGRPVATDAEALDRQSRIAHVRLADEAELILLCPCTADRLARMRAGMADDLLGATLLATRAPLYAALAMNSEMLEHAATQENLQVLRTRGLHVINPAYGALAEGRAGLGRLADPPSIVETVADHFLRAMLPIADAQPLEKLRGRRVLVTAGPTREAIDAARYLGNRSSGRMGYALARAFQACGAQTVLISGPCALSPPPGVEWVGVECAEEMRTAVLERLPAQDALVLVAAVADYRLAQPLDGKHTREGAAPWHLELIPNVDIAAEVGRKRRPEQILMVFAAESGELEQRATRKLHVKQADLIVANDITQPGIGFDALDNEVLVLERNAGDPLCKPRRWPRMSKSALAWRLAACVARRMG